MGVVRPVEVAITAPYGMTIFCDDVRYELLGKTTYVGCYQNTLLVDAFPALLSKLCLSVMYIEPANLAYAKTTLRVFLPGDSDDKASFEVEVPVPVDQPSPDTTSVDAIPDDLIRQHVFQLAMSPVNFSGPGKIKVRVLRGDQIIKLGSLRVLLKENAGSSGV